MKKLTFILNIVLLILWMGIIFNFSSDNGEDSSSKSEQLLIKICEIIKRDKLSIEEQEKIISKFGKPIRKMAHMFSYFILSILSFLLIYRFYKLEPITIVYTLIFCIIYAITDEIHQYFIPDRVASILDIIIDTCGAIIFLIIPSLVMIIRKAKS